MEVAEILKISRSKAYELMKSKNFPLLKIGKNIRIEKNKFLNCLHNQNSII